MRNVCRSLKGFLSLRQCFYHAPLPIQCKRSIWEYDLNAVEKATKYRVLCTHCSMTNNILNIVVYYIIIRLCFLCNFFKDPCMKYMIRPLSNRFKGWRCDWSRGRFWSAAFVFHIGRRGRYFQRIKSIKIHRLIKGNNCMFSEIKDLLNVFIRWLEFWKVDRLKFHLDH